MPVTLNGKTFEVAYGKRARREMEAAQQKGLKEIVGSGMVLDHAAIIWGAIKHSDKKLSVADVADLIEGTDYNDALKECMRALLHAAPFGVKLEESFIRRILGEDDEPGKERPAAS